MNDYAALAFLVGLQVVVCVSVCVVANTIYKKQKMVGEHNVTERRIVMLQDSLSKTTGQLKEITEQHRQLVYRIEQGRLYYNVNLKRWEQR